MKSCDSLFSNKIESVQWAHSNPLSRVSAVVIAEEEDLPNAQNRSQRIRPALTVLALVQLRCEDASHERV